MDDCRRRRSGGSVGGHLRAMRTLYLVMAAGAVALLAGCSGEPQKARVQSQARKEAQAEWDLSAALDTKDDAARKQAVEKLGQIRRAEAVGAAKGLMGSNQAGPGGGACCAVRRRTG